MTSTRNLTFTKSEPHGEVVETIEIPLDGPPPLLTVTAVSRNAGAPILKRDTDGNLELDAELAPIVVGYEPGAIVGRHDAVVDLSNVIRVELAAEIGSLT